MAVNSKTVRSEEGDEGGVYAQSEDSEGLKVSRSRDRGNTFGKAIRAGAGKDHQNRMNICGESGKGILVSTHFSFVPGKGYVKYLPLHGDHFLRLPYPFTKNFGLRNYVTACKYMGNNEYSILIIAGYDNQKLTVVLRGTLKDI
eukprot:TRINITY_DN37_c0_g1_i4.p4 TRINITY_DN37_c0_g1~~TRINITY_DN37_c0_g1_i4.p4  ORF type:complete len:144 (-),score=33.81 TRINITY_DN37_c0_g1_i4:151-582(-)